MLKTHPSVVAVVVGAYMNVSFLKSEGMKLWILGWVPLKRTDSALPVAGEVEVALNRAQGWCMTRSSLSRALSMLLHSCSTANMRSLSLENGMLSTDGGHFPQG
jgi:hypothetical protein